MHRQRNSKQSNARKHNAKQNNAEQPTAMQDTDVKTKIPFRLKCCACVVSFVLRAQGKSSLDSILDGPEARQHLVDERQRLASGNPRARQSDAAGITGLLVAGSSRDHQGTLDVPHSIQGVAEVPGGWMRILQGRRA